MNNNYQSLKYILLFIVTTFLVTSCAAPPEYTDGLIENIPAVVNDIDFFSFSLKGDKYNKSKSWDLSLNQSDYNFINTVFVVKEYGSSLSDSTYLRLYDASDNIISNILIQSNLSDFNTDSIIQNNGSTNFIPIPKKFEIISNKFTGDIDYQILMK